jgi:LPS export ABC transporter protein LptC
MVSPRNIRYALALLVTTACVGIVAAISFKGSRTAPPEPASKQLPQNIDVSLNDARFTEMRDGIVVWEMVASRADYDKNGENAFLDDVKMVFTKSHSNGTITVTASRGEYANASKNIRLQGKVHVVSESGMTFDSESLDYLAGPALFRTIDRVEFHHERLSLVAIGMEMDVKSEKNRFFKSIDAVVESSHLK